MLAKNEALSLYRKLLLIRRAEEKIQGEYFNDGMKTPVHLGIGQEAIPVGVCHCLPRGTKTFGTYRNHALYLTVTEDTDSFFAELYGKVTGSAKGKAGSMHLSAPEKGLMATSAVVGTTIPLAVGAALANAYCQSNALVVAFFGDGAAEEGVFWESLNFACLRKLRILLVCEDNGLAIHTPAAQRQGFKSIMEAVRGFQCYSASGDGSDVETVIMLTRNMLERMSEQPKPGFLHLSYFRFLEHVGPKEDFDMGYRWRPTQEEMEKLDPVVRFEKGISKAGCSENELATIKGIVDKQIQESVHAAQSAPFPASTELWENVLA